MGHQPVESLGRPVRVWTPSYTGVYTPFIMQGCQDVKGRVGHDVCDRTVEGEPLDSSGLQVRDVHKTTNVSGVLGDYHQFFGSHRLQTQNLRRSPKGGEHVMDDDGQRGREIVSQV